MEQEEKVKIVCDLMDNEEMALIQEPPFTRVYGQRWKELNYIKGGPQDKG